MLLKHLYDYAHSRNLLEEPAFTPKAVRWIIDLDANGNMIGSGPVDTAEDGRRGKEFFCPQTTRAKHAGGVSEFLVDGITALFGLESDLKIVEKKSGDTNWHTARQNNNAAKKNDYWRQITDCAVVHQSLFLLKKFVSSLPVDAPPFIRRDGNAWKITTATGEEKTLGSENFTFRINGNLLLEDDTVRSWWRERHSAEVNVSKASAKRGLCIVTAEPNQPIAETHGVKIMSVPGGQVSGASLISFDKDAFSSYGLSKSLNCPTSEGAATAYCTALNSLIKGNDTSLRIGGTVLCFWAKDNKTAGGLFASLLNNPDPASVSKFIKSPWAGLERELTRKDLFIAVTLKGCSGRVAVSHWIHEPLEQAIENFAAWFRDLELGIVPRNMPQSDIDRPLSVFRLAAATTPLKRDKGLIKPDMDKLKADNLQAIYRAAFEGIAPSTMLIKPILDQFRSRLIGDSGYKPIYDESRFALLKLILNRNRKDSDMEIRPQLTADTYDAAYNCGRLLSVLSEAQKRAHDYGLEGAGIVERYFGTASVSPSSVFPLLLKLNRHHLDKIRKSPKYGVHVAYLENSIRNISAKFRPDGQGLPPEFPRTLDLQAQGRFALGFYQQQAEDERSRIAARVLAYLKETDEPGYVQAIALQQTGKQDFYERINQIYGSQSFKDWPRIKAKKTSAAPDKNKLPADQLDLFDHE